MNESRSNSRVAAAALTPTNNNNKTCVSGWLGRIRGSQSVKRTGRQATAVSGVSRAALYQPSNTSDHNNGNGNGNSNSNTGNSSKSAPLSNVSNGTGKQEAPGRPDSVYYPERE